MASRVYTIAICALLYFPVLVLYCIATIRGDAIAKWRYAGALRFGNRPWSNPTSKAAPNSANKNIFAGGSEFRPDPPANNPKRVEDSQKHNAGSRLRNRENGNLKSDDERESAFSDASKSDSQDLNDEEPKTDDERENTFSDASKSDSQDLSDDEPKPDDERESTFSDASESDSQDLGDEEPKPDDKNKTTLPLDETSKTNEALIATATKLTLVTYEYPRACFQDQDGNTINTTWENVYLAKEMKVFAS
ncbi:MAG: hypothetical protein LBD33_00315, partial [Puniceicoccales bacterium]|nr:hypothetical protein [Puniceicoccales bacterium]